MCLFCFNSVSFFFLLLAKHPPTILQHPISAIVLVGHPFVLDVKASGTPAYQWYKDGFKLFGETNPVLKFMPFCYQHEGNYTCRIENSAGDALSNIATLQAGMNDSP